MVKKGVSMRYYASTSKNATHYYVLDSYRGPDGKVKTKIVCKIGEHHALLKAGYKDPLAYVKEFVKKLNEERKKNKVEYIHNIDYSKKLEPPGKIESREASESTYKNIGWLYLSKIFEGLHISDALKSKGKQKLDLANIVRFLSFSRILEPASKKASWERKDGYLGEDFSFGLHDVYRALSALDEVSDEVQATMYDNLAGQVDLDTSVLYYDCTNFYFETEEEDENEYDAEGNVVLWGMRRYGASKEHRPNPLVQMGLFTDSNGIPISYCLNHGSNNEQNTVIPLEKKMIDRYKASRFIYCSDGGLGSYENRFFNTLQGRNYIVSQSLKKMKESELQLIFKDMNWRRVTDDENVSLEKFRSILEKKRKGEEVSAEEEAYVACETIYKKFPVERTVPSSIFEKLGLKIGSKTALKMDETLFITFSATYFFYTKNVLERQISTAQEWVGKKDVDAIRKGPNDVRRFIKTIAATKEGELADQKANAMDEERVEEERRLAGFYADATSLDAAVKDIRRIVSARWQIEYSFRLMKTNLDSRPAYVSTESHIRAHFCICYIALTILRILEQKINEGQKTPLSPGALIKTLKNMNVFDREEKYFESLFTGSRTLARLEEVIPLGLDYKFFRHKELMDKTKIKSKEPSTLQQITTK